MNVSSGNITKKTVFIVDDNRSNLIMASEALGGQYSVMTFASGARVLAALEKRIPDLILLDVEMPEMDGYEVLNALKADSRFESIPVIFLTALNSTETELKGLELGASDYISKPFAAPLLRKRLEVQIKLMEHTHNLAALVDAKMAETNEKTKQLITLKNSVLKTTAELVEYRDENTGRHIERTQAYMKILIDAMKKYGVYIQEVRKLDVELVLQSSQLHDVGKISIRDTVLLKPGKLDDDEFYEIKKHTVFGENIILRMKENTGEHEFLEYARVLAVSHHEKWDGTGYPHGLKGEEIPLLGRIMAIGDVYDALVSERPYKAAFSHEKAAGIIIEGAGKHFDPNLVTLFEAIHNEFEEVSRLMR